MLEVTGTLKNATRVDTDARSPNLRGEIYGDIRGRFKDGTVVYTSTIVTEHPGDIFETKNSVYRVETWA